MNNQESELINEGIFKSIFETCEEGIVVTNKYGEIIMANKSINKMFGYENLTGMKVEELIPASIKIAHEKSRSEYHENSSPRRMGVGRDLIGLKNNGHEFPIEISLNTVNINGATSAVAFITDITVRKQMELALKKSEGNLIEYATQLEKRVQERTEELDLTISKLEESNKNLEDQVAIRKKAEQEVKKALIKEKELGELKSRFVSMASHEFRTPLSTILSSTSLIAKYNLTTHEENRLRHVDKIKSAIENLNGILNDFLSIAKLEEGKIEHISTEVDLHLLIENVLTDLSSLKKTGQLFIVNTIGSPRKILSDDKILTNILINLISNAIKYSEKNKRIKININFHDDRVSLEIEDEGIGITKEDQLHLFERFFRAKNVANIQGTGLGLNIVKKYAELLNGGITFKSEYEKGSVFTLTLPFL